MAQPFDVYRHPHNAYEIRIKRGFCWPALFFGCFWYAAKAMWAWAVLWGLVGLFTFGTGWIVAGFIANGQHRTHLLRQGYRHVGTATSKAASLMPTR